MKRVVIVGSPGTGKTTLASQLAAKTGLPVVHLDYYYHQKQYDYYHDKRAWRAKITDFLQAPEWIIDGNYSSTINERFAAADTIIFLDFSRWLAVFRVIKRRIHYWHKTRYDMPADWTEEAGLGFTRYVWSFNDTNRPSILIALQATQSKNIVILNNPSQVKKYLDQL